VRVLVTGGVRSGKSRHADSLITGPVTYLAPGPVYDDADWAARIAAHRTRRRDDLRSVESLDLVGVLGLTDGHVMVDCLGTWLTAVLDERGLWDAAADEITDVIGRMADEAADVLGVRDQGEDTVVVTNEVGLGVVPEHRSGRLFRDLLGLVNQRIAAACDEVHLVIAGRVVRL
jgi:adenosylcobinamide kinase/adenosylcobinamide-phosphate guanylyltransferase